jgi:hypothetical protein
MDKVLRTLRGQVARAMLSWMVEPEAHHFGGGDAMRSMGKTILGGLVTAPWAVSEAWGQGQIGTTPVETTGGGGSLVAGLVVIGALLALIIGVVKVFDVKRRREEEAVRVQSRITDALLLDPGLGRLPVVVTARAAVLRSSPMTVEISGFVHRADQRDAVLHLVEHEAAAVRPDYQIIDRLSVVPETLRRVA